ncbi:hypothetical protein BEI59_27700 [Eisenbergiella tayi]|uniref:Uncharacterized protein n=1 Tax=Eisenbergiella tayi TaxID=1432052 RepID=A0A1E3UBW5_9FIRM|nr:hypothetical protein BEI59_27700 [Eisenbergiella tayi]
MFRTCKQNTGIKEKKKPDKSGKNHDRSVFCFCTSLPPLSFLWLCTAPGCQNFSSEALYLRK